jgi:adenosylhomocysteine nucleosidase
MTIGILTGMLAEARIANRFLGNESTTPLIACANASPAVARERAGAFIEAGVTGLVSFGIAGALAPELVPGEIVAPTVIVTSVGGAFETDEAWRRRFKASLQTHSIFAASGPLYGSDKAVTSEEAKRRLNDDTGAIAVDMESHAVAEAAIHAGIPFLVVRVIADPANRSLPQAALAAMAQQGLLGQSTAVGKRLLSHPGELGGVIALARDAQRALQGLKRAARSGGVLFSADA